MNIHNTLLIKFNQFIKMSSLSCNTGVSVLEKNILREISLRLIYHPLEYHRLRRCCRLSYERLPSYNHVVYKQKKLPLDRHSFTLYVKRLVICLNRAHKTSSLMKFNRYKPSELRDILVDLDTKPNQVVATLGNGQFGFGEHVTRRWCWMIHFRDRIIDDCHLVMSLKQTTFYIDLFLDGSSKIENTQLEIVKINIDDEFVYKHFQISPTPVRTLNKSVQMAIGDKRYNLSKDFDKDEIMLLCKIFGKFKVVSSEELQSIELQSIELATTTQTKTTASSNTPAKTKSRKRKRLG